MIQFRPTPLAGLLLLALLASCGKAPSVRSPNPIDHNAQGELLLQQKRPSEAEQHFREALAIDPQNHAARANLVYLLSVECRSYEALAERHRLLRANQCTVEDLLYMAKPEDLMAAPELDIFLEANPEDPHLLLAKGRQARLVDRPDEAARWLNRTITVQPDLVEAHADLGLLLVEQNPTEQALDQWLQELPASGRDHPDVWLTLGHWAKMRQDPRGAARCFAEVLLRQPNHRTALHQLSLTLAALGEESQAAEFSARVKQLDLLARTVDILYAEPRSSKHWQTAAELMMTLGRTREAAAWYRTIYTLGLEGVEANPRALELQASSLADLPIVADSANPVLQLSLDRYPVPEFEVSATSAGPLSPVHVERPVQFVDRAADTGLAFSFVGAELPVNRSRRIFELFGGGIAVLDFDLDGWPDIYCAQGSSMERGSQQNPRDKLFRNVFGQASARRFIDITDDAQLGDQFFSQGAAVGDINNDGFPDLLLANVGENRLYLNNGDGTFSDISGQACMAGSHWTTSCALADLNGDALPDIYEVNYLGGREIHEVRCDAGRSCAPTDFKAASDRFFLNLGNGAFAEQTREAGFVADGGKGLGIVIADFGSGAPSVFVANDTTANHFYVNQSPRGDEPHFTERAVLSGLAYDRNGFSQACMGVAVDDANRDEVLDVLVTNFYAEQNTLYLGQVDQYFDDGSAAAGLRVPCLPFVGFGAQFLDADLDGDPDLVVANGHINSGGGEGFQMRPQFFQNTGGRFVELMSPDVGPYFARQLLGRAVAIVDYDRDGREDVVVAHLDAPLALLHNETSPAGRFLSVRLCGVKSDRDATGAAVTIVMTNGARRLRQMTAGDGYQCSNQKQLVFGLDDSHVAKLIVRWPSGTIQEYADVAANQTLVIVEGRATLLSVN